MTTIKPATPLPWKDGPIFNREGRAIFWDDTSKPGKWVRRVDGDKDGVFGQLDAAYIVAACNAFPELVAALRTAVACFGNDDEWWQTEGEARFQNQVDNLNLPHPTADVIRGQVAYELRALLAKLGAA